MEIWIEFNKGKWRVSPDPARIPRGTPLQWRFRGDGLNASHVLWTIYFAQGHPFTGVERRGISDGPFAFAAETFRLPDQRHVGTSPVITADVPGQYKYGVRLENLDEDRELGDEDPLLIVL
jgi:hypothetical protein